MFRPSITDVFQNGTICPSDHPHPADYPNHPDSPHQRISWLFTVWLLAPIARAEPASRGWMTPPSGRLHSLREVGTAPPPMSIAVRDILAQHRPLGFTERGDKYLAELAQALRRLLAKNQQTAQPGG